jgi:hypothetical protein
VANLNLHLAKVTMSGRDWTGIAIPLATADVTDITIYVTDRPGRVSGDVMVNPELAMFGASAYVFPTDERLWTNCAPYAPRMSFANVGNDGRFAILDGLPPGEYYVASTIAGELQYARAEYLRRLVPFAQRVRIDVGSDVRVTLRPKPRG